MVVSSCAPREREIEILTETQRDLKRDLRAFKADYVSADVEDVIRALRKRTRGLNGQVILRMLDSADRIAGRVTCRIKTA